MRRERLGAAAPRLASRVRRHPRLALLGLAPLVLHARHLARRARPAPVAAVLAERRHRLRAVERLREDEAERAPLPHDGLRDELAAEERGEALRDGEAEARAAGVLLRLRELHELVEDARQVHRRDA